MDYLLAISLGPVQEFIATARRSRDLWFGSWLLSELSKAAAESIASDDGLASLIFPATADPEDLKAGSPFAVANKSVAVVKDPAASAQKAKEAVHGRLRVLAEQVYAGIAERHAREAIKEGIDSYLYASAARAQVDDLVEFFWAAYPCPDSSNEEKYGEARERVESLLTASKVTRDFRQVQPLTEEGGWGSNAPKSSLDGQRESVIDDDAYKEGASRHLSPGKLRRVFGVRPGERLCGVGLLKRLGNRDNEEKFFSTSHVAALPLLERLKKRDSPKVSEAINTYIARLRAALNLKDRELGGVPSSAPYVVHPVFSRVVGRERVGYDGHLLFAERLVDYLDEKPESQKAKADLEAARTALSDFLLAAVDGVQPLPYYALLLADGDYMGAAISTLKTREDHRNLSEHLTAFAKAASEIVIAEHDGSLVYAGGDDVLAFVPLHRALQCARALSERFRDELKDFNGKTEGQPPTLSVGLVVAHHMDALSDALALARSGEREAKRVKGKNALAVTVSKRGGEDMTVKGSWGAIDRRLLRLVQLHLEDAVPDGAAYELRNLDLILKVNSEEHAKEYKTLGPAVRAEAIRVLSRKRGRHGESEIAESVLAELTQYISADDKGTSPASNPRITVGQLADELIVARVFAEAMALAEMKAKELNKFVADDLGEKAEG
ncbi:MAG: type III-B CRISPR-associated protein Cas10/Cmr2 [Acidobacteria bacterium]|nr:type III-B CRISPR-associated protein Cas10/Cmr2 [Acidobacteriota bacterium]